MACGQDESLMTFVNMGGRYVSVCQHGAEAFDASLSASRACAVSMFLDTCPLCLTRNSSGNDALRISDLRLIRLKHTCSHPPPPGLRRPSRWLSARHAFWHRDLRLSRLKGENAWGERGCGFPGLFGDERRWACVNAFSPFNLDNSRRCKKRAEPKASGGHRRHEARRGMATYASVG